MEVNRNCENCIHSNKSERVKKDLDKWNSTICNNPNGRYFSVKKDFVCPSFQEIKK